MNRRDFIKSAIIGAAGVSVPLGVDIPANTIPGKSGAFAVSSTFGESFHGMVAKASLPGGRILTAPFVNGKATFQEHMDEDSRVWIEEVVIVDPKPKLSISKYPHSKHSDSSE